MFTRFLWGAIIARAIVSWMPINHNNFIVVAIHAVTEPFISPVRKLIARSPLGGPGMRIDFSLIITMILVQILGPIIASFVLMIF